MTTLEQKQQAALASVNMNPDYSTVLNGVKQLCPDEWEEEWFESYGSRKRRESNQFVAGAEWAEAQQRWIPANEGKPFPNGCDRDHVDCWIVRKGRVCSELAAWNDHHQVWDKPDYDDSLCDHEDVAYWLPVKLPVIPPAQEGGQDGNNPDHSR